MTEELRIHIVRLLTKLKSQHYGELEKDIEDLLYRLPTLSGIDLIQEFGEIQHRCGYEDGYESGLFTEVPDESY